MVERYASEPQRVVIDVDVVVGYCVEGSASGCGPWSLEELLRLGADVTRVRIQLHGRIAMW